MKSINSWIKRNPLITTIICVLAVVLLTGFISVQTNGFNNPEDLFTRATNEDNLLKPGEDGNYLLTEERRTETGLYVTPKKNGAITISGNNGELTTSYEEFDVAVVTLEKGTYTLSSGNKDASASTFYLVAEYNGTTVVADFGTAAGTFTLTETTEVIISLRVCPNDHNATVYPVLVAGETAGSFYA